MGKWTEYWSDGEQDEHNNGNQIRKDDHRPSSGSQRSVRDPDCDERVGGGEGIPNSWIFVLQTTLESARHDLHKEGNVQFEPQCTPGGDPFYCVL